MKKTVASILAPVLHSFGATSELHSESIIESRPEGMQRHFSTDNSTLTNGMD